MARRRAHACLRADRTTRSRRPAALRYQGAGPDGNARVSQNYSIVSQSNQVLFYLSNHVLLCPGTASD